MSSYDFCMTNKYIDNKKMYNYANQVVICATRGRSKVEPSELTKLRQRRSIMNQIMRSVS